LRRSNSRLDGFNIMPSIDLDYAKSVFKQDGGFCIAYNARHNSLAVKHAKLGQTIGRFYLNREEDIRTVRMALQTIERRIAGRKEDSPTVEAH
jgi:hypothetical protein